MSLRDRPSHLTACGLPEVWRGRHQWRVLSTEFGQGACFFQAWADWRADPQRPPMLHWCALTLTPFDLRGLLGHGTAKANAQAHAHEPLVRALLPHWQGLLPGFHRIALDQGRVLLTLCVGEWSTSWRQLSFTADSVLMEAPSTPTGNVHSDTWSVPTLKALARLSHRGTRFSMAAPAHSSSPSRPDLEARLHQCGFALAPAPDPAEHGEPWPWHGRFAPAWEPKRGQTGHVHTHPLEDRASQTAVVIGAGLAGAAVAHSLAKRGWQVRVLDAAARPAMGASGLPAGLVVTHVSPDDSVLSQLSRAGLRVTRQHLEDLLTSGQDWAATGVMEHRTDAPSTRTTGPRTTTMQGKAWSHEATAEQLTTAGLPTETVAWWHPQGAWVKPAALVNALLAHPAIVWQGQTQVSGLRRNGSHWAVDCQQAESNVTLQASLVVLAAGYGSQSLLDNMTPAWHLPVQAVRGQASWAREAEDSAVAAALPPFPVNGHGSVIAHVPDPAGSFWIVGSTFERDEQSTQASEAEVRQRHQSNLDKLQTLLPSAAALLSPAIQDPSCQAFIGIRCASADRLPLVGRWGNAGHSSQRNAGDDPLQGLCISTAMGSRGLTFALLCAELLAAQLHGEPWPLERRLAQALDIHRGT